MSQEINPNLLKAVDHQQAKGTQSILVEEWDQEIFFTELTLADRKKLTRLSKGNQFDMAAYCLIEKATDAQGNKLYSVKDKVTLMASVDPKVVARIFEAMSPDESEEDIEKK